MKPLFIKTASGNVFSLYHAAAQDANRHQNILFIPPFAEELNRSRHMINRQARLFAKAGYGVLILDFFGTGDSEGNFGDASVKIWQNDIMAALAWLNETIINDADAISNAKPIIWAMRCGALIAADLIQRRPDITDHMILWSPVLDGRKFITQFLRISLSAQITQKPNASKTSLKNLWDKIESGNSLEIAGYPLSSQMAQDLSALHLGNMTFPSTLRVDWIDISQTKPATLPIAAQTILKSWESCKMTVFATAANDVAFWTMQEPEWANIYIEQTLSALK